MKPVSPTSGASVPGGSPLVEPITTDITEVSVSPVFGQLLRVKLVHRAGAPTYVEGAVSAVTVYGDGHIEYHTDDVRKDGAA